MKKSDTQRLREILSLNLNMTVGEFGKILRIIKRK